MATQTPRAETWREGMSTEAAAYVRPSRSRMAAASGAPVRARVARASVTSLASSEARSVILGLLEPGYGAHQHRLDAVAAAGGLLGLEPQAVRLDRRPRDRDLAEVLGHQAEHRVDVLLRHVDAEELVEVVDGVPRRDAHLVVG